MLDIGGQNVNGTVHQLVPWDPAHRYVLDVLDIEPGPGVTLVADATQWEPPNGHVWDLVITTECFEHVEDWPAIVATARRCLLPGGWFVGTAASIGRDPHGATGAPAPAIGEHYANVGPTDLAATLRESFDGIVSVEYERNPAQYTTCDVYWRAQA